jgi:hypothetical protein
MVMEIFKTLLKTGFNFSLGFPVAFPWLWISRDFPVALV